MGRHWSIGFVKRELWLFSVRVTKSKCPLISEFPEYCRRICMKLVLYFVLFIATLTSQSKKKPPWMCDENSTLRYECDETFSDECEFAARAEGEWCNHTCRENVFRTSIVRNFISRGVKMQISAREACVKPHLHTRSDIKVLFRWAK